MPYNISKKRRHTSDMGEDDLCPTKNNSSLAKPKASSFKEKSVGKKDINLPGEIEEIIDPRKILRGLVDIKSLHDQTVQPPINLETLVEKLSLRGRGFHVIPSSHMIPMSESSNRLFRELATEHAVFVDDESREAYGATPEMHKINHIVERAIDCESEGRGESSWNASVHYAVMNLAIGTSNHKGKVSVEYCPTTSIDQSYVPLYKNGDQVKSKTVDFALVLQPDAMMEKVYNEHKRAIAPSFSWNHTQEFAFRKTPIAVSIETKLTGMDFDEGMVQLCTWAIAHFNKLEALVQREGRGFDDPLFLPLILVQGHDWTFFALTKTGEMPVLWQKICLGTTNDHLGTYGLVAALQTLIKWCNHEYRGWFVRNIVMAMQ